VSALYSWAGAGFADVVHMWLWWAVYETRTRRGETPRSAYRAAQRAVAALYE